VSQRIIRRSSSQSRVAVGDLLEAVLVGELLAPGSRLWVVSPWLTDFPVIDNRGGQFTQLDPTWGASRIRISAVLRALIQRGVLVSVATRPGQSEEDFLDRLRSGAEADGSAARLRVRAADDAGRHWAHEKALVADTWALHGSMNFTFSGVELNGELVTFTDDLAAVAELASELSSIFEGDGA